MATIIRCDVCGQEVTHTRYRNICFTDIQFVRNVQTPVQRFAFDVCSESCVATAFGKIAEKYITLIDSEPSTDLT